MKKTIQKALNEAGKILMKHFKKQHNIKIKGSQVSIVTEADLASEKKIIACIKEKFQIHNIIAEESGYTNNNSEYTWVIDPLDGTSNYAAGLPWFGVLIAVLKDAKPIMAGVYLPFYKQMFFAEKGKGAFCNGKKIHVTKEKDLKKTLVVYSLDYIENAQKREREAQTIKALVENIRNLRSTNCVYDHCGTATGKFGASLNQTTKIWDIAAPSLIMTGAGGVVTDIGSKPLDFSANEKNYGRNFTIIASTKALHSKVVKIVASVT